jgi:T6SS, Transcription factor, DNA binding domain
VGNAQAVAFRPLYFKSLSTDHPLSEKPNMTKRDLVVADIAPSADTLTPNDKDHLVTYLRLLDASTQGAEWTEAARIVLGIDPEQEPQRARAIWESHLKRAKWMTTHGYKDLVRNGGSRIRG